MSKIETLKNKLSKISNQLKTEKDITKKVDLYEKQSELYEKLNTIQQLEITKNYKKITDKKQKEVDYIQKKLKTLEQKEQQLLNDIKANNKFFKAQGSTDGIVKINDIKEQTNKIKDIKKDIKKPFTKSKDYYIINVEIYKEFIIKGEGDECDEGDEIEERDIKRHWIILTSKTGIKFVQFRIFNFINMKDSNINNFQVGVFYNIIDNTTDVESFKKIFYNADMFKKDTHKNLYESYTQGFIIRSNDLIKSDYIKPNFKLIKYKADTENKSISSKYTSYVLNPNSKYFKDLLKLDYCDYLQKNFRANCCMLTVIINKFYKYFQSKKLKELSYDRLCDILKIKSEKNNIGLSIEDVMPFFNQFKFGFIVYDSFMNVVHKIESENKSMVLRILIKDDHVYELNKNISKLEQLNEVEGLEDIYLSNKLQICKEPKEVETKIHIVESLQQVYKYIVQYKNTDKTSINLKCIYNDNVENVLIELVNKYKIVPKVYFNNSIYKVSFEIEYINISIENADISTQSEPFFKIDSVELYNTFHSASDDFNKNFLNPDYISNYHPSVMDIDEVYKITPITGHFKKLGSMVNGLDMNKAYSTSLSDIKIIPVFSFFDVYKKYLNEPIENYAYYIVECLEDSEESKIIFSSKYARLYGFVLKDINIKYVIHQWRKPFKLVDVDFKTPVENLYNDKTLDMDIKKYIANKLTGLLETKLNKAHITKIFEDVNHAKYYQEKYNALTFPIKTITEKIEYNPIDDEISKTFINEDLFYIVNLSKKERLINGLVPIKDIIYCSQKLKLLKMYKQLNEIGATVYAIKTDCILYAGVSDYIIYDKFDINNKLGGYKIETNKYIPDVKLELVPNELITFIDFKNVKITTFKDEYDTPIINKFLIENKNIMIKSKYPGCGKTQCIKNLGKKILFILPENKLCQDILNENIENINAVTFSKLFGLYADDKEIKALKHKQFDLSEYDGVCFDEIAKHSPDRLVRICNFIMSNTNLLIFGAGDHRQIKPINYMGNSNYLDDCLNILFPNQILLTEIKRIKDPIEKKTIKLIYDYIFDSGRESIDIEKLCKEFNIKTIKSMAQVKTENNLGYFNFRCNVIANQVHFGVLMKKQKYAVNQEIVCRKRYKNAGITLNTNYTYVIKSYKGRNVTIYDGTDEKYFTFDFSLLDSHFVLPYCRTIDSSQGTTITTPMTIFDLNLPYVSKEHIWVAITRASTLKNVQIFIHSKQETERYNISKFTQYFESKINGYKQQDKIAGRKITDEEYATVGFIEKLIDQNNAKCCYCSVPLELYIDFDNSVKSDITLDRIDNSKAHFKSNCRLSCLLCNVSKK